MRRALDGTIYYLECNPRFFYKIDLSMMAGINFVRQGITWTPDAAVRVASGDVRLPIALVTVLWTPWRITRRDMKMLWYSCNDLVSRIRVLMGIDRERQSDMENRHFPVMEPLPAVPMVKLDRSGEAECSE